MSRYLRKNLFDIPPYIPGRSIESIQKQYGISNVIKLASNENPLGPSPEALRAVKRCLRDIHRYPDPNAGSLKAKLAAKNNLAPENFIVGNGLAETIDHIALAFIDPGDEVVLSYPTFPKYTLSVRRVMGEIVEVGMKNFQHGCMEIIDRITPKTKLVFIDTPCNPVGCKLGKAEQEAILERLPEHVVLVLDEAYRDFIDESECLDYNDVINERKNVIFLRTFSKGYGLSGLRVGYGIGNPEIIFDVNRVREVFNSNLLALAAAEAALDDAEHLQKTVEHNEIGKQFLYRNLDRLGYSYHPTYANFILINTRRDLAAVDEFLLSRGIIIRPIKLKDTSEGHIRVTIGKKSENRAFINAMEAMREKVPAVGE